MDQNSADPAQIQHIILAMIPFLGIFALLFLAIIIVPLWVAYKKAGLPPALSLLALIPGVGTLIALYVLAFARWKVVPAPEFAGGAFPPSYPPPGYVPAAGYAPQTGFAAPGTAPSGYNPPTTPPAL